MNVRHYPVCLEVAGRSCLVVGGGRVALRKVLELEKCGARIVVVAEKLCEDLAAMASAGQIDVEERRFVAEDVLGKMIVIAATDDKETNVAVRRSCTSAGVLVNVADVPELCDFTLPAVLRRGRLTVAVSTTGASPALAGRVRDEIAETIGPEWAEVIEEVGAFRQLVLRRLANDPAARAELLGGVRELDLPEVVRRGGRAALRELLRARLDAASEGGKR